MRIITNFEALDMDEEILDEIREGSADMEKVRQDVFETIEFSFDDAVADADSSLSNNYSEEDFVFGVLDRDAVVSIAQQWNQKIKEQFERAVKKVWHENMAIDQLQLDTQDTYEVSCAARELDNHWWYNTEHSVYLPNEFGFPYFRVTLLEDMKKDMIENPEKYVIVDVYVRS